MQPTVEIAKVMNLPEESPKFHHYRQASLIPVKRMSMPTDGQKKRLKQGTPGCSRFQGRRVPEADLFCFSQVVWMKERKFAPFIRLFPRFGAAFRRPPRIGAIA